MEVIQSPKCWFELELHGTKSQKASLIVHTTFELMMLEHHNLQIAIRTPIELPQLCYLLQIQVHTNCAVGSAAI
jgi:hypothetical protein